MGIEIRVAVTIFVDVFVRPRYFNAIPKNSCAKHDGGLAVSSGPRFRGPRSHLGRKSCCGFWLGMRDCGDFSHVANVEDTPMLIYVCGVSVSCELRSSCLMFGSLHSWSFVHSWNYLEQN